MYIITQGSAEIVKKGKKLLTVEKRGSLGSVSLLDKKPHAANAVAASQCKTLVIGTGMHGLVLNRLELGDIRRALAEPTHHRVFAVGEAIARGMDVDEIHALTHIDRWFLHKMANIVEVMTQLREL